MEKPQIVVKVKDTLVTKLAEPDPETLERVQRLVAKIPALGCLYVHPYVQKLATAAAEAERRVLEDKKLREMFARHGLDFDSDRADVLAAIQAEYLAASGRFQKLCELTLEGGL